MAKRYIKLTWQNSPSTATPINATNLNHIEKGIDDCDNAIEDLYDTKFNKSDLVNIQTNNTTKAPSAALAYSMNQQLSTLNDNLENVFVQNKSLGDMLSNPGSATDIRALISQVPSGIYIVPATALANVTFPIAIGSGLLVTWFRMKYSGNGYYYGTLIIRSLTGSINYTYTCSIFNNSAYSEWSVSG